MQPFLYLVPALYFNATVKVDYSLGSQVTGGSLLHAPLVSGRLFSEPGFEPQFTATVTYGNDFPHVDVDGPILRSDFMAVVKPDNGDTPFEMISTSIIVGTPEIEAITSGNTTKPMSLPYGSTYSIWTPQFKGGSANYSNLQNSIFVASETVGTGSKADEFVVGMKISKVFGTKTNVTIGQEFS